MGQFLSGASSGPGGQVAALSFWETAAREGDPLPRAWLLTASDPARKSDEDARLATLAIAYVYPWPTACDDQALRSEGAVRSAPAPLPR